MFLDFLWVWAVALVVAAVFRYLSGRAGVGGDLGGGGGEGGRGGLPQPFYLSSPKCHNATTTLGPGEKAESLRWIPDLDTSDASADFRIVICKLSGLM